MLVRDLLFPYLLHRQQKPCEASNQHTSMSKVAGKKRALTADEKAAEAARRRIKSSEVGACGNEQRCWLGMRLHVLQTHLLVCRRFCGM